ncbi:hypothetical protein CBR_g40876 [Chara braunii]|uniref:Uncharacterized protein n=1 Tax=Chara braunii TaxID=69332 RepID=A0A388K2A4_CHABU|nr:hypothetical protein CBR_g40876 [Chara braunii]|eukprot:GBG64176.1 hypothetical protein CBR_g40876 [Chara braunii]
MPRTSDEEAEEARSRTVALGRGSTQEWAGSQLYGYRETTSRQSFTELLEDGICESDNAVGANLSFGLCSGSSSAMTNIVLVKPQPDVDAGQVTTVGRSAKAPSGDWVAAKKTRERQRLQLSVSSVPHAAAGRPNWMQPHHRCRGVEARGASRLPACRRTKILWAVLVSGSGGRRARICRRWGQGCRRRRRRRELHERVITSESTTGSTDGFGKRKNMRQKTFEALTECMEKHWMLMATTMGSASKRQCSIQLRQCEAMDAKVEVLRKHYEASDDVSKLMCQALLEIAKAIAHRGEVEKGFLPFMRLPGELTYCPSPLALSSVAVDAP